MLTGTRRQVPLLDLKAQHATIREETLAAIVRVVDSQKFILGEEVEKLEAEIADYCQVKFAVGCASGSDALFLALLAADIGLGDRVITTPYTFFATAGAIARIGAVPVFVDVEPDTFNMDTSLLERALENPGVRAIIPVHLFGACANMDAIMDIASRRGLIVMEDAAQSIGAEYKGRRAGSIGQYGCLSFFPSKNLGGYGDSGMITTNDADAATKLKALRVHGRTGKYIHEWIGVNSRLDALQAAVLRVKLRYLDEWTAARQRNADLYRACLSQMNLPVAAPKPADSGARDVYNQFVIRAERRDELQAYLKANGIGTEVYYPLPLHLQGCFAQLGYKKGDFPVSEKLAGSALALPVSAAVGEDDIAYICQTIQQFYR